MLRASTAKITYSASARGRVASELGLPIECRIIVGIGYGDLRKGVDLFVRAAFTLKDHRFRSSSHGSARSTLPFDLVGERRSKGRYREPPLRRAKIECE